MNYLGTQSPTPCARSRSTRAIVCGDIPCTTKSSTLLAIAHRSSASAASMACEMILSSSASRMPFASACGINGTMRLEAAQLV